MVKDVRNSMYSSSVDHYIRDKGSLFITCALCNHETYFNHTSELKKCLLVSQLLDMEKAPAKIPSILCKTRTSSAISNASRMSNSDLIFDHSVNDRGFLQDHEHLDDPETYHHSLPPDEQSQLHESRDLTTSLNDISFVFEKYANKDTYFRQLFESLDTDKDHHVKVADIKRLLSADFQLDKYSQNDDHSSIHNEMELLKDGDLVNFDTFIRIMMYVLKSELRLKSQDMLELLTKKSENLNNRLQQV